MANDDWMLKLTVSPCMYVDARVLRLSVAGPMLKGADALKVFVTSLALIVYRPCASVGMVNDATSMPLAFVVRATNGATGDTGRAWMYVEL